MRSGKTGLEGRGLLGRKGIRVSRLHWQWRGVTLMEMIVVITILLILMGAALPIARVSIKRQRETDLRRALWEMRSAIDRYKDAADKNAFTIKLDSKGTTDWGLRSMQDDPTSDSWGGQNVFDVYTKSDGTGMNGIKYKDW
jgi:general secretion pathway protein G